MARKFSSSAVFMLVKQSVVRRTLVNTTAVITTTLQTEITNETFVLNYIIIGIQLFVIEKCYNSNVFFWCSDEDHPSCAKENGSVYDSNDKETMKGDATNAETELQKGH